MSVSGAISTYVKSLSASEFQELCEAVDIRKCEQEFGVGTFACAAEKFRSHPVCPVCKNPHTWRDGIQKSTGLRRFRCNICDKRYTSLTNTIFENSKKELPDWIYFIRLMRYSVPIDLAAEMVGISHQSAWEWRHRIFTTVNSVQETIVLSGRVWIDETYINDTELEKGYGQARKRGLSAQKICISVGIDEHKNIFARVCGHGKPSAKRVSEVFAGHIQEGSVLVHDKERAHNQLVRELNLKSEAYKADTKDHTYLEQMELVNNFCSWLKRYLWRFTGMSSANLQSYLNWYVYLFRVKQARDRWPETARILRHLMLENTTFRS